LLNGETQNDEQDGRLEKKHLSLEALKLAAAKLPLATKIVKK